MNINPEHTEEVGNLMDALFPLMPYQAWHVYDFNPYLLHLLTQDLTILHVEADCFEPVAQGLYANGFDVAINPTSEDPILWHPDRKHVYIRPPLRGNFIESILAAFMREDLVDPEEMRESLNSIPHSALLLSIENTSPYKK